MKVKDKIIFQESKRHLSSNLIKIIIMLNIIVSSVSAIRASPPEGFQMYYFDEILYHYFWFGLTFLIFTCLFISMKIMVDSKKNYSLISRFSSKKEFIRNILLIHIITSAIVIFACYMGNFLAFNIFSNTSLSVQNLQNYSSIELTYTSNLLYLVFFLIRTLILIVIINGLNVIFIYLFDKTKVLISNAVLFYYLFNFRSFDVDFSNPTDGSIFGFLDLKRYFRYPVFENFHVEVINSVILVLVLSIILFISLNIVKHVKSIEQ